MEENLMWLRRKQKVLVSLVHVSQFTMVVAIGANNSYVPYPNLRDAIGYSYLVMF